MAIIQAMAGTTITNGPPPPPPGPTFTRPKGFNGVFNLDGSTGYLTVAGSSDFAPGTGAFCVESFVYFNTGGGAFPRLFSVGTYPSASVAVSMEGGNTTGTPTLYFWIGGNVAVSAVTAVLTGLPSFLNNWHHLVFQRNASGICAIYIDGIRVNASASPNTTNINNTSSNLDIGAEKQGNGSHTNHFKGSISNFRWTNAAVYPDSNFTSPIHELTPLANTKYLLNMRTIATQLDDSSTSAHTTSAEGNVSYSPRCVPLLVSDLSFSTAESGATLLADGFTTNGTWNGRILNVADTDLQNACNFINLNTNNVYTVDWASGSTTNYNSFVYLEFNGANIRIAPSNDTASAAVAGTWKLPAYIRFVE